MPLPAKKKSSAPVWVLVILIILAIAAYFYLQKTDAPVAPQPLPAPVAQPAAPVEPVNEPVPHYEPPVVAEPLAPAEPLPELNTSDESLLRALEGLGTEGLLNLIVPQETLRKFVLAVNAVAEGKVVNEYRVVKSPAPPFVVEQYQVTVNGATVDQARVSAQNFKRYDAYTTVLSLLDTDAAVAMYKRFYPLLEEAYAELGLKKGNFHSVLIAAIDNVLAAPDVQGDLLLIQPKVFYQYADPALEKLPQTHKLMIRMGSENSAAVKASLRRLRVKLLSE